MPEERDCGCQCNNNERCGGLFNNLFNGCGCGNDNTILFFIIVFYYYLLILVVDVIDKAYSKTVSST